MATRHIRHNRRTRDVPRLLYHPGENGGGHFGHEEGVSLGQREVSRYGSIPHHARRSGGRQDQPSGKPKMLCHWKRGLTAWLERWAPFWKMEEMIEGVPGISFQLVRFARVQP